MSVYRLLFHVVFRSQQRQHSYEVTFVMRTLLLLLGICSIGIQETASAESTKRREFQITGDDIVRKDNRRVVEVTGHAEGQIKDQECKMTADLISFDRDTRIVSASGQVHFYREGHLTTGSNFRFKVDSDEYLVTEPGVRLSGVRVIRRKKAE